MISRQSAHKAATIAATLGVFWGSACRKPEPVSSSPSTSKPPTPTAKAPAKPEGRQVYTLKGVVRSVDVAEGEVTIAHEAMPGFMEAMVMPFLLKDKTILDDVRPGDIVHGPMVVEFRDGRIKNYELTDLTVTGSVSLKKDAADASSVLNGQIKPAPLRVGDIVPDFALTTQTGATLRLSELRGKVVALTFIYTRCPLPDFCPAVDAKFAELARRVSTVSERSENVRLLSISFDPEHDTPEVLEKHAKLRGAKPPWSFAVADSKELAKVGPLLGLDYYPERDQFAHNLTAAVIGPDGRLARLELGRNWTPADLFKTMVALISPRTSR